MTEPEIQSETNPPKSKSSLFTSPYKANKGKTTFNTLAFLFPSAYYAGYGNVKKGALFGICGVTLLTLFFVMGYTGWNANRQLPVKQQSFHWPYAIIAFVLHISAFLTVRSFIEGVRRG